ncbi:MAG TPA: histidinol dehydrogenase, partial [Burkholderiales bacterium]|nr:histidinol dehydrogenase [Burkholderiales bacterium]
MLRRLSTARPGFDRQLAKLIAFDTTFDKEVEDRVKKICEDVRRRGDAAVLKYTKRFDRVDRKRVAALELSQKVLQDSLRRLDRKQRSALEQAAARIRRYHRQQLAKTQKSITETDGTTLGQRVSALDRVGLYVPGGEAAYPSS